MIFVDSRQSVPWSTVREPRLQPLEALWASRGGSPSFKRIGPGVLEEDIAMETAVRNVFRPELLEPPSPAAAVNPVRTLTVTATYELSEAGRKALLLAGGDGRAVQRVELEVPSNRLHLVTVNGRGIARLKLQPRFEFNREQRIVQIDAPPVFDEPPSIEDLLRLAARNHQLERAFRAERTVERAKRAEADGARKSEHALAFLRDQSQRAAVWPAPDATRCYINTPAGQMRFDANVDDGLARDVVREALRRFRADVKAAEERRTRATAEHEQRHAARKAAVDKWVAEHATPDQKTRYAAGLLPVREAIEAITDQAFERLADRSLYASDGYDHLQRHARVWTGNPDLVIPQYEFLDLGGLAQSATAAQWCCVQEFQAAVPGADVRLHRREYIWKRHSEVPILRHFTILVTKQEEPFLLRREYLMPGEEEPSVVR